MKKVLNIFIKDEIYMLELTVRKAKQEEAENARRLAAKCKYEWPHDDTNDGTPIKIENLYIRPNFQEYSPV